MRCRHIEVKTAAKSMEVMINVTVKLASMTEIAIADAVVTSSLSLLEGACPPQRTAFALGSSSHHIPHLSQLVYLLLTQLLEICTRSRIVSIS